jgi:hypothetical protein
MINYGTQFYTWGWRLSLGLAAVPSLALTIGCLFVPDTPNSLVDRGYPEEARRALEQIRGVQSEWPELQHSARGGKGAAQRGLGHIVQHVRGSETGWLSATITQVGVNVAV